MKVAGSHKYWKPRYKPNPFAKTYAPDPSPRSMKESFSRVVVPLSAPETREKYVNALNQVRIGQLLEDMDSVSAYIAYKHNNIIRGEEAKRANFSVVTGSIDRIAVHRYPNPENDIYMTGYVSWVGRSSMETTVTLRQNVGGVTKSMIKATFVMVALDPEFRIGTPVSPLTVISPEENAIQQSGEKHRKRRNQVTSDSLFRSPPDEDESLLIHDLYFLTLDPGRKSFQSRSKPSQDVWMKDTSLKSIVPCQPSNRNTHGTMFGGFVLRNAIELAWASSWALARAKPYFVACDDIIYRRPVEIGSLLWMHQSVGYTDHDMIQTRVTAETTDPNDPNLREIANVFHFTFRAPLRPGQNALPRIMPESYGESLLFLDSRRRLSVMKDFLDATGESFYKKTLAS